VVRDDIFNLSVFSFFQFNDQFCHKEHSPYEI
jgi:hypothetical protein